MRDRETGRSRGFAFVTFSNEAEANAAIDNLNESDLDGRRIRVNPANTRGGGGGGGGGGSSKSLFFLYKTITRCPHHCRIRRRRRRRWSVQIPLLFVQNYNTLCSPL